MQMVFQDSCSSLNPRMTMVESIAYAARMHGQGRTAAYDRAETLLNRAGFNPRQYARRYPHDMPGGIRKRAMIALALACKPGVLLADEPTTALDVTVQIQILLLRQLQREPGMAIVFVTHDVGAAAEISGRIAVIYAGRFVETGTARQVKAADAPVYAGVALLYRPWWHAGPRARDHSRVSAQPGAVAARLPVRPALPLCGRCVPPGRGAGGDGAGWCDGTMRARGGTGPGLEEGEIRWH